jgi:redox-sensing transcriptional repressor
MPLTSAKTIARLSLYRRLLTNLQADGVRNVYSHQLAALTGGTAAQVRRDIMAVGCAGSPTRGYDVEQLCGEISGVLDDPDGQAAALVGVGNLGRALLAYFLQRRPKLMIRAAFDSDPAKAGRVINGCRCHPLEEMGEVIAAEGIEVGIIAVPVEGAQRVADRLTRSGVTGLLNFAPTRLRVGEDVFVEDIDLTTSLEKVAFFARTQGAMGRNST